MDQEIKAKWVAALRSGDYKQGHNQLMKTDGSYCCLGVLCAIQGETFLGYTSNELASSYVPDKYRAGLGHESQCSLAFENDVNRRSFQELADIIEKDY